MTNFTMPPAFPTEFQKFGLATRPFFPKLLSDEDLNDPLRRLTHFDWAWQAVRYRYRLCAECNEEFKALLVSPSEEWKAGWGDEELTYKLERCIYSFFMGGLSVFESFGFCLYFLGHSITPSDFPAVAQPRKINLKATYDAFQTAFPQDNITVLLASLLGDAKFSTIDNIRNILAHRLSGRLSSRSSYTKHEDGTHTTDFHEETWHVPGATEKLMFDDELLQRYLDDITSLLASLALAAREFTQQHQPAQAHS